MPYYFLPPKVSDVTPRRATSTPQPSIASPKNSQPVRRTRTDRRRSASLGVWVKNMFPSQRPERGGTCRKQGYWEQMETEGRARPRRRVTDSQYSVGDVSVDSSHIARWNVARDLSENQQRVVLPHQQRVVTAGPKSSSSPLGKLLDRNQISVTKLGGVLRSDGDGDDASNSPSRADRAAAAETISTGMGAGMGAEAAAERKQPYRRELLRARVKARRRQRQSLKESGDYLGVQGVNPHTGELDVMSPTDSSAGSTISHQETAHSMMSTWREMWRNNRRHKVRGSPDKDELTKGGDGKVPRLKKEKRRVRDLGKAVRWKRPGGEWSSLQEPDLSPITQSLKSASPSSRGFLFLL
ncbi:hypothetical protein Trco_004081 [Trichoderma cornu-damae]|uniref:Uncharacterized protein n=1 Tax=Trichoderma cornu-damae TaxID=654480 RepID=A0A9P8QS58_9HYPO|nr:hypothetical protein Trco_004081 [Trichoderma cornu-damae]